jgi:hypothetical protein
MAKITKQDTAQAAPLLGFAGATADTLSNKANGRVAVGGKIGAGALQGAAAGAALGPIGMAVGAGIGAIAGGITASKTNKAITEQEEMERKRLLENRETSYNDFSKSVYASYPTQGVQGAMMYGKYGGMMPKMYGMYGGAMPKMLAKGGLMPLTNTTSLAVGDKHGMDTDGDGRPGVPVMDANGNQKAELENKEITFVDALGTEKVLSAELGTAKVAQQIINSPDYMKREGMFEKKVANINKQLAKSNLDKFTLGTNQERLRGVKHPLDNLYNEQEKAKAQMEQSTPAATNQPPMMRKGGELPKRMSSPMWDTIEQGAYDRPASTSRDIYPLEGTMKDRIDYELLADTEQTGSNFMKIAKTTGTNTEKIAPVSPSSVKLPKVNQQGETKQGVNINDFAPAISFIDNAYNAYLNTKRPPIPTPEMNRALPVDTRVSIAPELTEGRNMLTNLYRNLDSTTDNSQVARANKIAAMASSLKQINTLQGRKTNLETELKNRNTLNVQQIANANTALMNQFNREKMMAKDDIMMANSENVANAVTKATMLIRQENLKELDKQKMRTILAKYKNSGVLTRAELDYIDELEKGTPKSK